MAEAAVVPVEGSVQEYISLPYAKVYLRIAGDIEQGEEAHPDDGLLADFIAAARQAVENEIHAPVAVQSFDVSFDGFSEELEIPVASVTQVDEVSFVALGGASVTLDPDVYALLPGYPARVVPAAGQSWPEDAGAVRVRVTGGAGPVPPVLRAATLMMLAHLYENRLLVVIGTISSELPMAFRHLCAPFRWNNERFG